MPSGIDELDPSGDPAKKVIGDGSRTVCNGLNGQSVSPQRDEITDPRILHRREIEGDHVHRYSANQRRFFIVNEDRSTRSSETWVAIPIANGSDSKARRVGADPIAAVTHGCSRFHFFDADEPGF